MFVILTYDVKIKRDVKILKICRRYLTHVQKSVFEGMITESRLKRLKHDIAHVINMHEDQVAIYGFDSLKYSTKELIGAYESQDNIL